MFFTSGPQTQKNLRRQIIVSFSLITISEMCVNSKQRGVKEKWILMIIVNERRRRKKFQKFSCFGGETKMFAEDVPVLRRR